MAELGAYYITIMPSMKGFTSSVNKSLKGLGSSGGKGFGSSFTDVLKGSAIGTVLGNLATRAGSSIMGGVKTGIGRLDTIKNFPKVMESLGYETGQADRSIKLIMDHLDGLPTATQDVVTLTQSIADSTGDLDLATKAALGFNDMMLANGASAGEMTQAQGVLNRVLGKGNATVAQWQSLQSVMPAQLAAVARELGGESMSVEELRDKLNDGEISWNDFLQAIVRLDNEGSGAMKSFYEQAVANSNGIGTALENIPNRIGAGWAEIFDAIGREDIAAAINNMSYGARDAMKRIADGIRDLKERLTENGAFENLQIIMEGVSGAFGSLADTVGGALADAIPVIADLIDDALQWFVDHGEEIGGFVGGVADAIGKVADVIGGALMDALPTLEDLVSGSLQWLLDNGEPLAVAVGGVATAFVGFTLASSAASIIGGVATSLETLAIVLPLVTGLRDLPTAFALVAETGGPLAGLFGGISGALGFLAGNPVALAVAAIGLVVGALATWILTTEDGQKAWDDFCKGLADLAEGLKRDIKGAFDQIKQNLEDNKVQWEKFKENIGKAVDGIKTKVTSVVTGTIDQLKKDWGEAKDSVLKVFGDAKKGIGDAVEGIKGLFDFEWSLPAPKLPHFSWSWQDVGGILSIPSFSVDWYAKGGVFDAATLIGIGEAGKEAALPLNQQTYREMAHGIVAEMNDGGGVTIEKLADTIIIREVADVDEIMDRINTLTRRERGAMA